MVNLDVDEYLYSPAFSTFASMLRNLSAIERGRGLPFSGMTSVNLNLCSNFYVHTAICADSRGICKEINAVKLYSPGSCGT